MIRTLTNQMGSWSGPPPEWKQKKLKVLRFLWLPVGEEEEEERVDESVSEKNLPIVGLRLDGKIFTNTPEEIGGSWSERRSLMFLILWHVDKVYFNVHIQGLPLALGLYTDPMNLPTMTTTARSRQGTDNREMGG